MKTHPSQVDAEDEPSTDDEPRHDAAAEIVSVRAPTGLGGVSIGLAVFLVAGAVGLHWFQSRHSSPADSIVTTFAGYGRLDSFPDQAGAFFVVSNAGPHRVVSRGIGPSAEKQSVQVRQEGRWVDTDGWLSPGARSFELGPEESREVAVLVSTNLEWRVGIRVRKVAWIDYCPALVESMLPHRWRRIPAFNEVWSEPVPPLPSVEVPQR